MPNARARWIVAGLAAIAASVLVAGALIAWMLDAALLMLTGQP